MAYRGEERVERTKHCDELHMDIAIRVGGKARVATRHQMSTTVRSGSSFV